MKVINFSDQNSVVSNFMSQLRDAQLQQDRPRFRRNLTRIGQAMAYELSKTLQYSPKTVETPLAPATVNTTDDRIIVGTVLRAGLAFHEGFLSIFDQAEAGFVAAYRVEDNNETADNAKPGEIEIRLDYLASPHLDGCTFLLVDPMFATGKSFVTAHQAFLRNGTPAKLHICAVIASQQGVDYLQSCYPGDDVTLWVAAIDPELNAHSYIVPGLGDAGDLCFGEKISR